MANPSKKKNHGIQVQPPIPKSEDRRTFMMFGTLIITVAAILLGLSGYGIILAAEKEENKISAANTTKFSLPEEDFIASTTNIPSNEPSSTSSSTSSTSDDVFVPKNANVDGLPPTVSMDCIDRHEHCQHFGEHGECTKSPGWMTMFCSATCDPIIGSCELRNPKLRCDRQRLGMETKPIYKPGDMNQMFSSIQERFGDRYGVTILSEDPWVVTFENFLSEEEADSLVSSISRWERSTDTGSMNEFGEAGRILSSGRTSSNGWCTDACEENPFVQSAYQKIAEVTGVPRENYESFQVLRYEHGQKYVTHHDYGEEDIHLACGPRILTFFLYLSDVEEGGETAFPLLNIAVRPKKGMALLWPSTLDMDPEMIDKRTIHEARPVIKGTKFAANAWIHMYDYTTPNLWGCTGSFDE